uniref:Uncharacterized protein n=1 Tax=Caenorhabditis japonica TaxID=281687 RepID=A0A8R1HUW7_CAEJA
MKFLLFLALLLVATHAGSESDTDTDATVQFRPHLNKHHVYRTCGETLGRRVVFLCNGGFIRPEILSTLDCCSIGCSDRQLFSWCDV